MALEVLHRVDADRAFSGALLRKILDRAGLSPAEEALATELTLGTLRHRAEVDWALSRFSLVPLEDMPSRIRNVLRMGAYQLMFLSRIPPAAACSQAVELAKQVGHPGTVRLVNALLRKVAASPVAVPLDDSTPEGMALRYSHPVWLVRRWMARFGAEDARALCHANNATPPASVRLNTLRGTPETVAGVLEALGVRIVRSGLAPEGARIVSASPEARRAGYAGGWFSPQDEGSMLVSRFVVPRPGETVVDACAGSGGKTIHLGALMENRGRIAACDVVPAKLDALTRQCLRTGVTIVEPHLLDVTDAARLRGALPAGADRVLVDAPCSGLGAIRRRPEIKWRILPEHLPPIAARQRRILEGAAQVVRPGGMLVFSACTIEPEEGQEVVSHFIDAHEEFEPVPIDGWPPPPAGARHPGGSETGAPAAPPVGGFLYPHRHGTDGFFVAALRRRRS